MAEGRPDEAAELHVKSCAECLDKLEQLQAVMALGDLRFYDAPAALIADAIALMPAPERRAVSLLRSTTAWSGARAVAEDFQIVVGDGDTQIRLMYARSGEGWEVLGKAPSADWSGNNEGRPILIEKDGRFSFQTKKLSDTNFTLAGPEGELYIPSAEELLSRGPEERD